MPEPVDRDSVCRLCGGDADYCFTKLVLGRHDVDYFRCTACGSVQTMWPTWLDEAYSFPGLHIDVGAPTRSIKNWLAAATLLYRIGLPPGSAGLDFGSGPGLFSGLMRSVGFDFKTFDSYMPPLFYSDYSIGSLIGETPSIIAAFEVFEHLPEPSVAIAEILKTNPAIVLFTTWPIDGHDENWIYFLPSCGQHVFFYSMKGLRDIFEEYGYEMRVSMYFYIAFDPAQLTAEQVAVIEAFSAGAPDLVAAALPGLVGSVIMGNPYIDADFSESSRRFDERLDATVHDRERRFGPALRSQRGAALPPPSASAVDAMSDSPAVDIGLRAAVLAPAPIGQEQARELSDALAELTTRHERAQARLAYLLERSAAERVLFSPDGVPCGALRRMLFRRNGKVRRWCRALVLDGQGRPRRPWRPWMTGESYRALPKAHRFLDQASSLPAADGVAGALSPRTAHLLDLMESASGRPPGPRT